MSWNYPDDMFHHCRHPDTHFFDSQMAISSDTKHSHSQTFYIKPIFYSNEVMALNDLVTYSATSETQDL